MGFISLGCPKNLVDSEVMMGLLDRAGARLTARPEDAEILVVNTCSFIDTAKQESVDTILEMARHKTHGRASKLIVAGCLVERYRDEIQKNIPEVDAVVGTGELESILEAAGLTPRPRRTQLHRPSTSSRAPHAGDPLRNRNLSAGTAQTTESASALPKATSANSQGRFRRDDWHGAAHLLPTYLYDETTPRLLSTPPLLRLHQDRRRLRPPLHLLRHSQPARQVPLAPLRVRRRRSRSSSSPAAFSEITLIGQDTTCYGEDLGLKDGLATLLDALARIDGLRWLRFLYAYPNRITGKLLDTIAKHDNICKYLDVPAAARLARRAQTHEARRRRRHLPQDSRKGPRRRSRHRPAHHLHRRLPRRVRRGL